MNEIKKLAAEAKRALDKLANGKSYPANYVCERLELAKDKNPGDVLIGNARDVFLKRASKQSFFSQKEIGEVYNSLYGLSGSYSAFREELGDLLGSDPLASVTVKTASEASRIPYEKELTPMYGESEMSKEFSGLFSLDKKASFSALSDNTLTKAAKFAKVQLTSLGCHPSEVKVVSSNEHFILCNASIETSDFSQVNIPIPVQVTNGIPSLPQAFVQGDELVKLNKENLYVFIKDKNNHKKKAALNSFVGQRASGSLKIETPDTPSALADYANLDNMLVAAASKFSANQVTNATAVLSAELSSLGLKNAQLNIMGSDKTSISYEAKIPANSGTLSAKIAVDMSNGRPMIPTKFEAHGESYKLNRDGLRRAVASSNSSSSSYSHVSRDVENMGILNYSQLIGEVEAGVSSGDYKRAEDALGVIQSRFESAKYVTAMDHFSKLLKHASGNSERDKLIKAAYDRGDLIHLPTSVQLYCPKLGLPVSKVAFDHRGRPVPMTREYSSNSLTETGSNISSTKITLT